MGEDTPRQKHRQAVACGYFPQCCWFVYKDLGCKDLHQVAGHGHGWEAALNWVVCTIQQTIQIKEAHSLVHSWSPAYSWATFLWTYFINSFNLSFKWPVPLHELESIWNLFGCFDYAPQIVRTFAWNIWWTISMSYSFICHLSMHGRVLLCKCMRRWFLILAYSC